MENKTKDRVERGRREGKKEKCRNGKNNRRRRELKENNAEGRRRRKGKEGGMRDKR